MKTIYALIACLVVVSFVACSSEGGPPPECTNVTQCEDADEQARPWDTCTLWSCTGGQCVAAIKEDGAFCGNFRGVVEMGDTGVCTAGRCAYPDGGEVPSTP